MQFFSIDNKGRNSYFCNAAGRSVAVTLSYRGKSGQRRAPVPGNRDSREVMALQQKITALF